MNKKVNQDSKNLTDCLNANKICLNVSKAEVAWFKLSRKSADTPLNLKLNGKRLYPTNSVKYWGEPNLETTDFWSDIAIKLRQMVSYLN